MWWADLQWVHFAPEFSACLEGFNKLKVGMQIIMFSALISERREPGLESGSNPQLDILSPCPELQHGTYATEELNTPAHWDSAGAIAVPREGLGHLADTDDV